MGCSHTTTWSTRLPGRSQRPSQPSFHSLQESPLTQRRRRSSQPSALLWRLATGAYGGIQCRVARKAEGPTPRSSLAGQACPAVLVETRRAVVEELGSCLANRKVQQGQGQGPAPGEEQPHAPVQAGADLLESSSAERDWECWRTTS